MGLMFLVLALASMAARIRIGSLYLGALGALVVGFIGGHCGVQVPAPLMDFGVLILIFVVGVQAGPRFLRTFKKDAGKLLLLSALSVGSAIIAAVLVIQFFPIPREMFIGALAGGLSSAAALAAVMDGVQGSPASTALTIGYTAAYPISTILSLLAVPLFLKIVFSRRTKDEEYWASQEPPALERRSFRITNPALHQRRISEIEPLKGLRVNLSRINRGDASLSIVSDFLLESDDIVTAVGEPSALDGLSLLFGEMLPKEIDLGESLISIETFVTSRSAVGRSIAELKIRERFGVTVTRVRREGAEFLSKADMVLELGDILVVVGEPESIERFSRDINPDSSRLDEAHLTILVLGLALGIFLGSIPVSIFSSTPIKLGPAGGVFLVSMLLGYFRGIGRIRLYLPPPAASIIRELGLLFFIVGTGTMAGRDLTLFASPEGLHSILVGGVVTLALILTTIIFSKVLKFDSFAATGLICGVMNTSSALPRSGSKYLREVSTLFYASLYPVTLILKVIVVQLFAVGW